MHMGKYKASGFTLIEAMITAVIIAIVAAVAIPQYQDYVRESRRTAAKAALSETAQALERCFTKYGAYDDTDCTVDTSFETEGGFYDVSVDTDSTSFLITAAPKSSQKNDGCGSFQLDQTGKRTIKSADDGKTVADCW